MKKSYEIRIQETTTETKVVKGSWGKVIDDSDAGYGYADDQEREVESTNTVYEQTVNGLDIARLICMINAGTKLIDMRISSFEGEGWCTTQ